MIHILNGDSLTPHLDRAKIEGERIVWREALVAGPTPNDLPADAFRERRADFLSEAYGEDRAVALRKLEELDRSLAAIPSDEEVVLWFDRDLFCRVNLWCAAHRLRTHRGTVSLVDGEKFLCELSTDALRAAFEARGTPHPHAVQLWEAYTAATPERLNALSGEHPFVVLHLARFPSARNGLGAIEQAVLTIVSAGETTFSELFQTFSREHARYGFGDLQVLTEITRLATLREPLLTLDIGAGDSRWARIEMTDRGRSVMNGESRIGRDDINVWLGGAHVSGRNLWEWDERKKAVRLAPPLA